jgi:hypothetical protein
VLGGHKKVGTRFVPAVLARLNFNDLSYVNDLLPEIVWIGLANRQLGYVDGAKLCSAIAKAATECRRDQEFLNFALLSSYENLREEEVRALVSSLETSALLSTLREVVEPLVELFVQFPMHFAGRPLHPRERPDLIEELKHCVGELLDRTSTPAGAAQATVVYTRVITGGLHYADGLQPPDLNAIVEAPATEAAERAAAIVRATVLGELMPGEDRNPRVWPRHFWNHALHLDACEFASHDV